MNFNFKNSSLILAATDSYRLAERKIKIENNEERDLIIPLSTAVSVYANGMFINNGLVAALVLGASFIGLVISILSLS